jgi:hypothetical protein
MSDLSYTIMLIVTFVLMALCLRCVNMWLAGGGQTGRGQQIDDRDGRGHTVGSVVRPLGDRGQPT